MPTERSASVPAGLSVDVAPASRGPHVIVREVCGEEARPSKRLRFECAGYANCKALPNWIWSWPKPEIQTVSELLPPTRATHIPTERSASVPAGLSISVAPASRGPHVIVREV